MAGSLYHSSKYLTPPPAILYLCKSEPRPKMKYFFFQSLFFSLNRNLRSFVAAELFPTLQTLPYKRSVSSPLLLLYRYLNRKYSQSNNPWLHQR